MVGLFADHQASVALLAPPGGSGAVMDYTADHRVFGSEEGGRGDAGPSRPEYLAAIFMLHTNHRERAPVRDDALIANGKNRAQDAWQADARDMRPERRRTHSDDTQRSPSATTPAYR